MSASEARAGHMGWKRHAEKGRGSKGRTAESWPFWVKKGRYGEEAVLRDGNPGRRRYCGWRMWFSCLGQAGAGGLVFGCGWGRRHGSLALRSAPEPCFLLQLPVPKPAPEMPRPSASRRPSKYRLLRAHSLPLNQLLSGLPYPHAFRLELEVPPSQSAAT